MARRFIVLSLLFFSACSLAIYGQQVRAQFALSMTIDCPSRVYAGESFFCQVTIYNNENASHVYKLVWVVDIMLDSPPTFNTSGTIGPYGVTDTGSSFTFSDAEDPILSGNGYNDHEISFTLMQDGYTVTWQTIDINVLRVGVSLIASIQPVPISQNGHFSLNLKVSNEGDETINVTVRVYEVTGKIQLQSANVATYGPIFPGLSRNQTFNFDVTYDTASGEYPIKVWVRYSDSRGDLYSRNYYVTVPVSSSEVADELKDFELTTGKSLDSLRSDLDLAIRSLTITSVALLAVTVSLGVANYLFSRRILRSKRRVTA